MLALTSTILLQLIKFVDELLVNRQIYARDVYHVSSEENDDNIVNEVLKPIVLKIVFYFQIILVFQIAYGSIYHWNMDIQADVCNYNGGYIFLNVIGEFECQKQRKYTIWVLDIVILLLQLVHITNCLVRNVGRTPLIFSELQFGKYGFLTVLLFHRTFPVNEDGLLSTRAQGNDDQYGSIAV